MSIRTIEDSNELQALIRQYPLVIVAGLRIDWPPGDMEFERLVQENDRGQSSLVFAKFIIERAPELEQDFAMNDIATLTTFYHGEKVETVGFEPPRWEEMVRTALSKAE